MRNLKRVLSLTLASVMLMGMMVIGSSAAEGFYDVDKDEDNIEAIDVLQTIEVMVGYPEDGGFHPDDNVTRAEMMVIMAKLLKLDYDYYATVCPFTDVPDWAKGYVGAAYANKVAVGRGDGIFDPNSSVTPVEASAFLMRALGYFQYSNDYADGFELSTVSQGSKIGIYSGVSSSASEPMTRNQVAKMVLNTLESGLVQPDGNTINLTTPDGSVLTGKVNYVYVTSSKAFATAISSTQATAMGSSNSGYIVEMGEQLYDGDLKLSDGRLDYFGRPSRYWEYDGKAIGTYMKKELLKQEYTTKVTGKQLYELLGSDVIKDYEFVITIDGETTETVLDHNDVISRAGIKNKYFFTTESMNRTNTNQVGGTGNGVLTQVFVDGDKHEVRIAIINTYLAIAESDYNSSKNQANFTIYNIREVTDTANTSYKALVKDCGSSTTREVKETGVIVYNEDIDVTGIKANDVVLVRVAEDEVKEILTPDTIDDATITAFKTDSYVVTGGDQINYAHTAMYDVDVLDQYVDENMKNKIYRVYLDPYGYLIGIKEIEGEDNYVFLTGINSSTENLRDQTAIGNVIFLDGTSKNVTIDMKESKNARNRNFVTPSGAATYLGPYYIRDDTKISALMNTWCTYSVDENGVYTLREVANTPDLFGTINDDTTAKLGQSHMGGTYFATKGDETDPKNKLLYDINTQVGSDNYSNTIAPRDTSDGNYTSGNNAVDEKYVEINKGHVTLEGLPYTIWQKVYGNNDTVYLTAETEYLSGARNVLSSGLNNQKAVIITGAESVAVGVQDVDLTAYNAHAVIKNLGQNDQVNATSGTAIKYMDVSNGVYTLFDKNGYVIAAMVVGGDEGTNVSYAWVSSSDMNREAMVDGKWEYSRSVIIGGEAVTLTEFENNGLSTPDIANIVDTDPNQDPADGNNYRGDRMGYWWEVKTKADGTVKEVIRIKDGWGDSKRSYVYDINDDTASGTTILNQSFGVVAGSSDPLYRDDDNFIPTGKDAAEMDAGSPTYKVRVAGNTLQVEGSTGTRRGFAVHENAKVVLVKDEEVIRNNMTSVFNYKADIEYFNNDRNASGLTQAVNRLTNNDNFVGYISAVLVDGRADVVIIYDKSYETVDNSTVGTVTSAWVKAYEKAATNAVYVVYDDVTSAPVASPYYNNGEVPTAKVQQDAVLKMFRDGGYDATAVSITGTPGAQRVTVTIGTVVDGSSYQMNYYIVKKSDWVDPAKYNQTW